MAPPCFFTEFWGFPLRGRRWCLCRTYTNSSAPRSRSGVCGVGGALSRAGHPPNAVFPPVPAPTPGSWGVVSRGRGPRGDGGTGGQEPPGAWDPCGAACGVVLGGCMAWVWGWLPPRVPYPWWPCRGFSIRGTAEPCWVLVSDGSDGGRSPVPPAGEVEGGCPGLPEPPVQWAGVSPHPALLGTPLQLRFAPQRGGAGPLSARPPGMCQSVLAVPRLTRRCVCVGPT